MTDWIINNKEWLFSGAGVAGLMILKTVAKWVLARVRESRDRQTPAQKRHSSKKGQLSSASTTQIGKSIREILKDIESRPPLQQDDTVKHYLGSFVHFEGSVFYLSKLTENTARVVLEANHRVLDSTEVEFLVSTIDHPKFKFIEKGSKVTVVGKIAQISVPGNLVTLEDVEFGRLL